MDSILWLVTMVLFRYFKFIFCVCYISSGVLCPQNGIQGHLVFVLSVRLCLCISV